LPPHGHGRLPRAFRPPLSRAARSAVCTTRRPRARRPLKALRYLIPLGVFALLVAFFAVGLTRDPREVPSPLVDKPAPVFHLQQLHEPQLAFTPEEMKGKVWLLNVWASWCVSCRVEHPLL